MSDYYDDYFSGFCPTCEYNDWFEEYVEQRQRASRAEATVKDLRAQLAGSMRGRLEAEARADAAQAELAALKAALRTVGAAISGNA